MDAPLMNFLRDLILINNALSKAFCSERACPFLDHITLDYFYSVQPSNADDDYSEFSQQKAALS